MAQRKIDLKKLGGVGRIVNPSSKPIFFSTGSTIADITLKEGGIGGVSEFFGKEGTGKCVGANTVIITKDGASKIKDVVKHNKKVEVLQPDKNDFLGFSEGVTYKDGIKEAMEMTLFNGLKITSSPVHKFRSNSVYKPMKEIQENDLIDVYFGSSADFKFKDAPEVGVLALHCVLNFGKRSVASLITTKKGGEYLSMGHAYHAYIAPYIDQLKEYYINSVAGSGKSIDLSLYSPRWGRWHVEGIDHNGLDTFLKEVKSDKSIIFKAMRNPHRIGLLCNILQDLHFGKPFDKVKGLKDFVTSLLVYEGYYFNSYPLGLEQLMAIRLLPKSATIRGIRQVPVKSVKDVPPQPLFDLSFPENHLYIANGIMTHNTTFALGCAVNACQRGIPVLYLDVEGAIAQQHIELFGLGDFYESGLFIPMIVATAKEVGDAVKIFHNEVEEGQPYMVVIDSIASIYCKADHMDEIIKDGNEGTKAVGVNAKVLTELLSWVTKLIGMNNGCLICVNQAREIIDMRGGSKWNTGPDVQSPGGRALKHYNNVQVFLSKSTAEKVKGVNALTGDSINESVRQFIWFKVPKSKWGAQYGQAKVTIDLKAGGVDDVYDVLQVSKHLGYVELGGGGYWKINPPIVDDIIKGQGSSSLEDKLKANNFEIYVALRDQIYKSFDVPNYRQGIGIQHVQKRRQEKKGTLVADNVSSQKPDKGAKK